MPRPALKFQAGLGTAGPDGDTTGQSTGVGGAGDGAAQQAGGEDDEVVQHATFENANCW